MHKSARQLAHRFQTSRINILWPWLFVLCANTITSLQGWLELVKSLTVSHDPTWTCYSHAGAIWVTGHLWLYVYHALQQLKFASAHLSKANVSFCRYFTSFFFGLCNGPLLESSMFLTASGNFCLNSFSGGHKVRCHKTSFKLSDQCKMIVLWVLCDVFVNGLPAKHSSNTVLYYHAHLFFCLSFINHCYTLWCRIRRLWLSVFEIVLWTSKIDMDQSGHTVLQSHTQYISSYT